MLQVEHLSKSFGGLLAIDDLSLTVEKGQFVGILGANGAGKTTLLNLITGYLKPSSGSIVFEGKPIDGLAPYRVARTGIARTFQVVQPFNEMSVLDNVIAGALFSKPDQHWPLKQVREFCMEPLRLVGLDRQASQSAGELTLGAKKKLEFARALATQPRLLLLDEVMGGLNHSEIEDIKQVLSGIHQGGTSILMIEHVVQALIELSDYVYVVNFGRELTRGRPHDVIHDENVIEAYLGKPLDLPHA
ncbi:ABC transporter ATP-binding protein [Paraburkholderia sp. MM6662-R1]|uniref:ABC transporter ATP-binding protein n=1 Tax=Paraburkholderia sp. MM6662-R1 TaxID=2991066 RepID=UPI003D25B8A6